MATATARASTPRAAAAPPSPRALSRRRRARAPRRAVPARARVATTDEDASASRRPCATLRDARATSAPLADALGDGPDAVPDGPAVFALLLRGDGGDGDDDVAYVGASKRAREAIAAAARSLACSSSELRVARASLPKASRKPALRAAAAAWIAELGRVPSGNAAEDEAEAGGAGGGGGVEEGARERPTRRGRKATMADVARVVISADATKALCEDGFVVLDDVLPLEFFAAARKACEALKADGKMEALGQDGRDDLVGVLDAAALPRGGSAYGGVTPLAELLLAIPDALRARAGGSGGEDDKENGRFQGVTKKKTTAAEETRARLKTATPPPRLMLANYPGSGARYVSHLDNDPNDPGHLEGEVGSRACDRAVTAIVYMNDGWEESRGGCLRIVRRSENGGGASGAVDVAPSEGRLVLFDCRRVPHEVLPAHHTRWAMTAWIND